MYLEDEEELSLLLLFLLIRKRRRNRWSNKRRNVTPGRSKTTGNRKRNSSDKTLKKEFATSSKNLTIPPHHNTYSSPSQFQSRENEISCELPIVKLETIDSPYGNQSEEEDINADYTETSEVKTETVYQDWGAAED